MALKPLFIEDATDVSFFMNEVAEKGVVVSHVTASSGLGEAMDDADAIVQLPNNTGGSGEVPAGVLLCDVVSLDLTRQHRNEHKNEVQVGSKVTLMRRGQVVTNMVVSGENPAPGDVAYFAINGNFSTTSTNSTQVGRFLGSKDADGYVKVDVNIR